MSSELEPIDYAQFIQHELNNITDLTYQANSSEQDIGIEDVDPVALLEAYERTVDDAEIHTDQSETETPGEFSYELEFKGLVFNDSAVEELIGETFESTYDFHTLRFEGLYKPGAVTLSDVEKRNS